MDGQRVWPEPDSDLPPSRIRTLEPGRPLRLTFGSCRERARTTRRTTARYGVDVLRAYAHRMAEAPRRVAGPAAAARRPGVRRRDVRRDEGVHRGPARRQRRRPATEVVDFEEYTELYRLPGPTPRSAGCSPPCPADDLRRPRHPRRLEHLRTWRAGHRPRSRGGATHHGGLGAYWVYQHLGNISAGRAARRTPSTRRAAESDGDAERARRVRRPADAGTRPEPVELLARLRRHPARHARQPLRPPARAATGAMLDRRRLAWLRSGAARRRPPADRHVAAPACCRAACTTWRLERGGRPPARGARRVARPARRSVRRVDLEHWARSAARSTRMAELLASPPAATGGPATVMFLSGDVHYSYVARAHYRGEGATTSRVHQVVCSPIRNPLSPSMRYANVVASSASPASSAVGSPPPRGSQVRNSTGRPAPDRSSTTPSPPSSSAAGKRRCATTPAASPRAIPRRSTR